MKVTVLPGGDGEPLEPDWSAIFSDPLDAEAAHREWGVVVRTMQSEQTLTVANGHAIQRLVEFRVQYERAARHVAEKGAVLPPTTKKAKVGQWNPHWSVMIQADTAIRIIEAELGLSPLRRGKAGKTQRAKKAPNAAAAYLGTG